MLVKLRYEGLAPYHYPFILLKNPRTVKAIVAYLLTRLSYALERNPLSEESLKYIYLLISSQSFALGNSALSLFINTSAIFLSKRSYIISIYHDVRFLKARMNSNPERVQVFSHGSRVEAIGKV